MHNLSAEFVQEWTDLTKTELIATGRGDIEKTSGPEDVLLWLYALFHSPEYRRRYRNALAQRFPIVLFPSDRGLLREMTRLGGELVALHLVEAPEQQALSARYDESIEAWRCEAANCQKLPNALSFKGPDKPIVGKVGWSDDTVWIDAVKARKGALNGNVTGTAGFCGVPQEVWNFRVGGYQVCEKWLKDRGPKKGLPGRVLTAEDIAHYQRIVIALHETIRIMRDVDEVIGAHGGWPDAFITSDG